MAYGSQLPPELQPFDPAVYRGPNSVGTASQFLPPEPDPYFSAGYDVGRQGIASPTPTTSPYDPGYATAQINQAPTAAPQQAKPSNIEKISDYAENAKKVYDIYSQYGTGISSAAPTYASALTTTANPAINAGQATLAAYDATPIVGSNAVSSAAPAAEGLGASAGAALGYGAAAYGAYDLGTHHYKPGRAIGEGALAGAYFGPWGMAIGALYGLVSSTVFNPQGGWKKERNRFEDLKKEGVYVPDAVLRTMPTKARKPKDLIRKDMPADFVGRDPQGNWVNNKFASSRNVADLQGTDLANYSAFARVDPNWFHRPDEDRIGVAQEALNRGLVREHHGTIDIRDDEDFKNYVKGGSPAAPTSPTAPPNAPATGAALPKGARISPGVYSNGRGGSTLATPNVIPRAARR